MLWLHAGRWLVACRCLPSPILLIYLRLVVVSKIQKDAYETLMSLSYAFSYIRSISFDFILLYRSKPPPAETSICDLPTLRPAKKDHTKSSVTIVISRKQKKRYVSQCMPLKGVHILLSPVKNIHCMFKTFFNNSLRKGMPLIYWHDLQMTYLTGATTPI